MPEKIMMLIYKDTGYITSQNVSGFRADQIAEIARIKEGYGFNCRIKRYPDDYDIQAETGINVNDYLRGEV